MRKYITQGFLIGACLFAFESSSRAHINLEYPTSTSTDQKTPSPCGTKGARKPTTFKPGETIIVKWTETVGHPGHFRIAFDTDGVDDLKDPTSYTDIKSPAVAPILADGILAHETSADNVKREFSITFPNVTCTNCTLQLLQMMTDKKPFGPGGGSDFYYRCADIILAGEATGDGGAPDAGSDTSAGTGGASGTGGTTGTGGSPGTGGSTGSGGSASGGTTGSGGSAATGGSTGSGGSKTGGSSGSTGGSSGSGDGGGSSGGCSVGGRQQPAQSVGLLILILGLVLRRRRLH